MAKMLLLCLQISSFLLGCCWLQREEAAVKPRHLLQHVLQSLSAIYHVVAPGNAMHAPTAERLDERCLGLVLADQVLDEGEVAVLLRHQEELHLNRDWGSLLQGPWCWEIIEAALLENELDLIFVHRGWVYVHDDIDRVSHGLRLQVEVLQREVRWHAGTHAVLMELVSGKIHKPRGANSFERHGHGEHVCCDDSHGTGLLRMRCDLKWRKLRK
jgi:hypothetical protein